MIKLVEVIKMKDFDELTRLGRIRRSRKIVELALKMYNIDIRKLTFLTEDTNIFFKIVDSNEKKYAVKIYEELSSDINDSLTEMYMINLISEQTDIKVPSIVKNNSGDDITLVTSEYSKIQKRIAVYTWLDGKDLDGIETTARLEQLGGLVATMHKTSMQNSLPKDLKPKRHNKVLYYAGDDYFYRYDKHKHKVNDKYVEVMDYIIPYLDGKLEEIYKEQTPMLIHGDLNPYNVKVFKDEMRILDFEDAMYAMPVHDIAIILFYYRYSDKYEVYKKALFNGYEKIMPLSGVSDEMIEMLIAARRVNFLNYILEINEKPQKYIETNLKRIEDYINKYIPEYK